MNGDTKNKTNDKPIARLELLKTVAINMDTAPDSRQATYPDKIIIMYNPLILTTYIEKGLYTWYKVAQKNKKIECVIIADKDLENVQVYDQFLFRFEKEINSIVKELKEEDQFFINISSGTPAMKNALVILQDLNEYNCKFIQVSTPERKMNQHTHEENLDLEVMWELNAELERDGENRCAENVCPSLSRLRKEEIIKKHIDEYDYRAALSVARSMERHSIQNYIEELQRAANRYNLNMKKVDRDYKKDGFDITPVKSGDARKLFEYALWLNIKEKRQEYIDFVRGITPIVVELFEVVLKSKGKLDINDYCKANKYGVRKWDQDKVTQNLPGRSDSISEITDREYREKHSEDANLSRFNLSNVYSEALLYLLRNLADDTTLLDIANNLRSVEEKVRNLAAHDIVSLDGNDIKNRTGFTPSQIMDMIKKLFAYTNFGIKPEYWNSYEEMNRELKRRISDHAERS